jgi:prevent-host-death family protein
LTWPYGHGYSVPVKTVAAGRFKNTCLRLLDEVAENREAVVITKRGRPVAKLVPVTPAKARPTLTGSVLKEEGDPFSTGESWDDGAA